MASSVDNKTVLHRYVAAVQRGDAGTMRASFTDDASWTVAAGDLPIAGTWRGPGAILDDFLALALDYFEPGSVSLEITNMIAEGDQVVLQWTTRARTRAARDYENDCIAVFTIKDGRITAVREYMDTLYARDTVYGAVGT